MSIIINACAGVCLQNQQVLLACRPQGKSFAGYWEFPGGKLEAGETAAEALIRELNEEIGIVADMQQLQKIGAFEYNYPHGHVYLSVFLVLSWQGKVTACEQQGLYWQDIKATKLPPNALPTTEAIFARLGELDILV